MTTLLQKIEKTENELEFAKSNVQFPESFKFEDTEIELLKFTEEKYNLKKEAVLITEINSQKELMYRQFSEYIETLEKPTTYSFSKSQGLSFAMFYVSPLMDVRNILFLNLKGIKGVELNTTKDPKDAVDNLPDFIFLLRQKREEVLNASNLYDLYLVCQSFSKDLKKFR